MTSSPNRHPAQADLGRPSAARVYDYFLGGSSNFAIDRDFAREALRLFPGAREYARLNRMFLQRAVRFMADNGIRQFLDIGSGIPTVGAVHEVAQASAPESRVVYVDNEAIAIAHSEVVLEGNDNAAIVRGDMRAPEELLRDPGLTALLDTSEPIGVLMLAMLHFVPEDDDPAGLVDRYRRLLAPGSYLAISHGTDDDLPEVTALGDLYKNSTNPAMLRTKQQVTALLAGFEPVEPGIVFTPQWRPEAPEDVGDDPQRSVAYAGVGYKP